MSAVASRRTRPPAWVAVGVGGAVGAAALLLASVDPHEPGHYPACPFLTLTGWWCPGCGSLRGLHDLLHGDVAGAAARNPLLLLAVPYLLLSAGGWLLRQSGREVPSSTSLPPRVLWGALLVVVGFGVLRNLPGMTWLSPA